MKEVYGMQQKCLTIRMMIFVNEVQSRLGCKLPSIGFARFLRQWNECCRVFNDNNRIVFIIGLMEKFLSGII